MLVNDWFWPCRRARNVPFCEAALRLRVSLSLGRETTCLTESYHVDGRGQNGSKHSIHEETNKPRARGPVPSVPSPCSAPHLPAPRGAPHILTPSPLLSFHTPGGENSATGTAMETQPPQQVTISMEELMRLLRENPGPGPERRSAKEPDTATFSAEGTKVAEDLDRFRTALSLKFEVEADRFTLPRGRINYVFSRLEGRASAMCGVGIQENRYGDWGDMIGELELAFGELEVAFGELDSGYVWDRRLLNLRQGGRPFADHIIEFRTIAQRASFGGTALKSVLRNSLSRELEAEISTKDVRGLELTPFIELLMRHDRALRAMRPWAPPRHQSAQNAATPTPNNPSNPTPNQNTRPRPTAPPLHPSHGAGGYQPMGLDRQAVKDRAFREGRCFQCNQRGHISRSCPVGSIRENSSLR